MDAVDGRKELFARIRAALRGQGCAAPGASAAPRAPETPAGGDSLELFRMRLGAQGGLCLSGPDMEPLLPALGESLRTEGVGALLVPDGDAPAGRVAWALAPFGPFTVFASQGDLGRRAGAYQGVTAGISSAEFAIAETGTIVQSSRGGATLLPGLLPQVHVALVPRGALVPTIEDCLPALLEDIPRNISFITGPSRTADIEQTLTVGAHGPRKVIVLLLP